MIGIPKIEFSFEAELICGNPLFTRNKSEKSADLYQIELYPKSIFRFGVQFNEPWTVVRQPLIFSPHLKALSEGLAIRSYALQKQASTKLFQIRTKYFWVFGRHLIDMCNYISGTETKIH